MSAYRRRSQGKETGRMEIRVCPGCGGAFYTLPDTEYIACPGCGFVVRDRRTRERLKSPMKLTFHRAGEARRAMVTDFSEEGARIEYSGRALPRGVLLTIDIEDLSIHGKARTVWTGRGVGAKKVTGLRFLRGR